MLRLQHYHFLLSFPIKNYYVIFKTFIYLHSKLVIRF